MGNLFVMSIFGKMRLQIGVIMLTGVYLVSKLNNI